MVASKPMLRTAIAVQCTQLFQSPIKALLLIQSKTVEGTATNTASSAS